MRPVIIAILALCASSWGAITHVANDVTGTCNSDVATTCAVSYTPVSAGDMLVVSGDMFIDATGTTLNSIIDNGASGGSSYTCDVNVAGPTFGAVLQWVCRTCVSKSGITTVTANFSAGGANQWPGIIIVEFSGAAGACLGQVSAATTDTNATVTTAALTPVVSGELSIASILEITGNFLDYTGTNGWTCVNVVDPNTNKSAQCWKVVSGTGSTAATATGTLLQWQAYQVLYLPALGGHSRGVIF